MNTHELLRVFCIVVYNVVYKGGIYVKQSTIDRAIYEKYIAPTKSERGRFVGIEIEPHIEDLEHLRTFKFEDLTYRGTIEFRSVCTQPISDSMSVAAFHVGLLERVEELRELLYSDNVIYPHGYSASELQRLFAKRELPDFADGKRLKAILHQILDIASDGLKQRGKDEEIFLNPLYERASALSNPAKSMLCGMENGRAAEDYIRLYSLAQR